MEDKKRVLAHTLVCVCQILSEDFHRYGVDGAIPWLNRISTLADAIKEIDEKRLADALAYLKETQP